MFPWKTAEARLVQSRTVVSGAGALGVNFGADPVPTGKVWCVIAAGYFPDAAETRTVGISKFDSLANRFQILNPISVALNPMALTLIEQGMEMFLLPGEYLGVDRDAATAGSAMIFKIQFIEMDLPLYDYDEPQVVKRQERALSSVKSMLGGGAGGSRVSAPTFTGERGGRTGPLKK